MQGYFVPSLDENGQKVLKEKWKMWKFNNSDLWIFFIRNISSGPVAQVKKYNYIENWSTITGPRVSITQL